MRFKQHDRVLFLDQECVILKVQPGEPEARYYVATGPVGLPMWLGESQLSVGPVTGAPTTVFEPHAPHLLVVDDFFRDPDAIRALALAQEYVPDLQRYKGKRTAERFLWPFLKEEFERLLGSRIVDWLQQPANGCFQLTGFDDPLVWHSDTQSYAGAVYLTPHAPVGAGTSFWRDRTHGCRRPPWHPQEARRFPDAAACDAARAAIYSAYNVVHPDNWELVDRVGSIYNRLVLWDGELIHSASSYEGLQGSVGDTARLVQLFFFSCAAK